MKLLIYISTDGIFTTAVNTPHFNSLWVYTVSFHLLSVKSPVSFCTPVAFFLSLAAKLHIYLCKCNFYEKVFLYEDNQNFVMIFINTKHTMRSVIHGRGLYSRLEVQEAFLDTRHSQHTHIHTPKSAGCTHPPWSRFTPISTISTIIRTEHSGKHQ